MEVPDYTASLDLLYSVLLWTRGWRERWGENDREDERWKREILSSAPLKGPVFEISRFKGQLLILLNEDIIAVLTFNCTGCLWFISVDDSIAHVNNIS